MFEIVAGSDLENKIMRRYLGQISDPFPRRFCVQVIILYWDIVLEIVEIVYRAQFKTTHFIILVF